LEEGQVEVSNAAGRRLISPGQVVRVSGPNNQIEVMPALVELFQSQSLLSFQSDSTEGFAVRELTDESDALVDRIGHDDDQGRTVVAGGVVAFTTDEGSVRDGAVDVLLAGGVETGGSGSGTFLNSASFIGESGGSTTIYYEVSATASIVQDQGSTTVIGATDSVDVHWGIWDRNDYQVTRREVVFDSETTFPETPNNDWHYMIADNVLAAAEVEALGLTGTFTYNYGGGTTLIEGGDGLTATVDPASTINVDFANLGGQGISYNLVVNDNSGSDISFLGSSDLASLYSDTGVSFVDADSGPATLSISGTFAGNEAQALVAGVEFNDGLGTADYYGTALFEKEVVLVTGGTGQGL
jgi:hypothetical protein